MTSDDRAVKKYIFENKNSPSFINNKDEEYL